MPKPAGTDATPAEPAIPSAPDLPSFALLENLPVGVALCRTVCKDGKVVDFASVRKNQAFLRVFRLEGEPEGTHFERFPDARSSVAATRLLETIQRVLASGRPETVETYTPSTAQSYRFDIAAAGHPDYFLIVLRKVTDQIDRDAQLRSLLKEQEFLFESQSIGYWKSINRVFCWSNAAFDQMLGYQRHELLGKSTRLIYVSQEAFEDTGCQLGDSPHAQTSLHFDTQFVRKDGKTGWYEVVLHRVTEGDELTLIGSCIDRSRERATLLALKESELRLQTCLKGSGAIYFDWDLGTGEMAFDQSIAAQLGIAPGNSFESFLALVHRHDRETVQNHIESHIRNDIDIQNCEFRMRRSSGQWVWVLLRASVVEYDEAGHHTPKRMAGTLTDVTTTKRLERETEQLLGHLEHLIKERASPHGMHSNSISSSAKLSALSRRQIEVLRLIASGNTSGEIARRLHISEATVQSHRKEIMQKLGQKNIATLTRFAIESGLI